MVTLTIVGQGGLYRPGKASPAELFPHILLQLRHAIGPLTTSGAALNNTLTIHTAVVSTASSGGLLAALRAKSWQQRRFGCRPLPDFWPAAAANGAIPP